MIKPQISVTWINTKKKRDKNAAPIIDPIPVEYIAVTKEVLHSTVEKAEDASTRLAWKVAIGTAVIVSLGVVLNTGGQILVNALDNRTTE